MTLEIVQIEVPVLFTGKTSGSAGLTVLLQFVLLAVFCWLLFEAFKAIRAEWQRKNEW